MTGRIRLALAVIAVMVLVALAAPWLTPYSHDFIDWRHQAAAPQLDASHWLGTDRLGRDLFARSMQALRVSLLIGLVAAMVSVGLGVAWGAVAGYVGGRLDAAMMRFVDIVYALPYVFIVIILASLFDRGSLAALILAIGAVGWLTMARIVRGQTLSLRHREFIDAAIVGGVRTPRILWRHILPNVAGPVIAYAALTIPQMVLFESFLSFLGLGVQEPFASLGSLINEGAQEMESAPWMLLVPATSLTVLLVAFNVLGDGLRARLESRND
ncbi:MAG TPA: ABC transporter permease subunit [Steroidobacteraceae bacterium]